MTAPPARYGHVVSHPLDHYAMRRATQEMLGAEPLLGAAAGAADLRSAFGL